MHILCIALFAVSDVICVSAWAVVSGGQRSAIRPGAADVAVLKLPQLQEDAAGKRTQRGREDGRGRSQDQRQGCGVG